MLRVIVKFDMIVGVSDLRTGKLPIIVVGNAQFESVYGAIDDQRAFLIIVVTENNPNAGIRTKC